MDLGGEFGSTALFYDVGIDNKMAAVIMVIWTVEQANKNCFYCGMINLV
jgi:hypothetical protein